MTAERRAAMGQAAVEAAKAVGYVGAGTVEFIAHPDGRFYFMEMNTRLQVEHPVTEMITGLDLVEWQLRVAFGEALPRTQDQLAISGHAIEARIYAEDPDKGFLPSTGRLVHLAPPAQSESVRVDTGVEEGDAITPFYDPMIAKLIVHGADRAGALARMKDALAQYRIVGVANNVEFLGRLVASDSFVRADLDTALIEREHTALFPAPARPPEGRLAARRARRGRARCGSGAPGRRSRRRPGIAVAGARRLAAERQRAATARLSPRRDHARGRRRRTAGRGLAGIA
jgi:3-methylcrotonyl-CoA carboxylase alpha subunit